MPLASICVRQLDASGDGSAQAGQKVPWLALVFQDGLT